MFGFVGEQLIVLYFELLLFFRDRKVIFHALGFFIIVTILFPIALSPQPELLQKFAPGILWVAALLGCLLALENWLHTDIEDQALEQLLLSSIPLPWLITLKIIAFWIAVIFPLILVTPLLGMLLHLSWANIVILCASLLVGTPALIAVGATCKALTLCLQQQGAILGLLMLPLTLPILIMGVNTLMQASLGLPVSGGLAFLAGVSLLCVGVLPGVMAYVLRWGMD